MSKSQIIYRKIDEIKPYENNPRKNDDAIQYVVNSIKEFGFRSPIIIDKDDVIIAGHTRLEAAKRLKLKEVPTLKADDLSEDQVKALRLADNKTAEFSEWDTDLLDIELGGIDLDMSEFGFDVGDIIDTSDIEEDDYEEPEELEPTVKLGEIWRCGEHYLMCGDATSKDDVQKLVKAGGGVVDMVFTDPPYGMCLDTDFSSMVGIGVGNKYDKVIGDNSDFSPKLITTVFENFPNTKEIFLWGADYYAEFIPDRNKGSWIVWDKMDNEEEEVKDSYDKMFGANFELCWSKQKHKRALARVLWKGIFGLSQEDTKSRVHPTQKPTRLVKWFFDKFKGDVVADLYGGSGSTMIACEQTHRKCLMMELDPHYCDVIIDRWQTLTGGQAEKVEL